MSEDSINQDSSLSSKVASNETQSKRWRNAAQTLRPKVSGFGLNAESTRDGTGNIVDNSLVSQSGAKSTPRASPLSSLFDWFRRPGKKAELQSLIQEQTNKMAYLEEQLSIKSVEAGVLKQNLNQKSDESTKLTSQISKLEDEKRSGLEEVEELKEKFQFQDDKQTKTIVALFAEREKLEKLFQQEKEKYNLDSEQKIEGITAKLVSLEAANKFQISENERLKSLLKTSEEERAKFEQGSFIIRTTLKETVKQAYSEIESQIGEIKQLKKEEEITRLQNLTSQLLSDSEKLRATISNLESDKDKQFQTIRELTKELYVKTVELDEHKSNTTVHSADRTNFEF